MSSKWQDRVVVMAGVVLAAAGLLAAGYGWRVAMAQSDYYRLKYGTLVDATPVEKAPVAERAHALYPRNYYLCQLMVGDFRKPSAMRAGEQRKSNAAAAADWCARGRRLNPYGRELAWMAAGIAGVESPEAALAIWEPYVERVFWDPWNLASLISLQVQAGQVESARALLPLLQGRPEYAAAARAIGP